MTLSKETCNACRADAPKVTATEAEELLLKIPEWKIEEHDAEQHLVRVFKFSNFADALAFTIKTGELAENADHHPALITEWGKTTVHWWTHKIRGLHRNDFIMAARTDELVKGL